MGVRLAEPYRRQHLVEQLSRAANERLSLQILVPAGRLADDHQPRLPGPTVKAQRLGGRLEAATIEALQQRMELLE